LRARTPPRTRCPNPKPEDLLGHCLGHLTGLVESLVAKCSGPISPCPSCSQPTPPPRLTPLVATTRHGGVLSPSPNPSLHRAHASYFCEVMLDPFTPFRQRPVPCSCAFFIHCLAPSQFTHGPAPLLRIPVCIAPTERRYPREMGAAHGGSCLRGGLVFEAHRLLYHSA